MLLARIALLVAVCSQHHLPCCGDIIPSSPSTKIQDKADSPFHPSNADNQNTADNDADDDATDNDAEDDADVDADNNNAMQTMDDNADDG